MQANPVRAYGVASGVIGFLFLYTYLHAKPQLKGVSFSTVAGFFDHHTDASEMESFFAHAPYDPKFGLILPTFKDLHDKIEGLKANGNKVKVLYLLRHAEGYHNAKEKELNNKKLWWDVEGRKEDYIDADLNPAGIRQSEELSGRLGTAAELGIRFDHIITSPLRRAVRTAGIGFNLTEDRVSNMLAYYKALTQKKATAIELARETTGQLTCDKRLPSSELSKIFPWVDYSADYRETVPEKRARVKKFLEWLWGNEHLGIHDYIVISTHSGWINAILRELNVIDGSSKWKPANAQMMGLVIRMDPQDDNNDSKQNRDQEL
ncbi:hypothetical protein AAMO2058_000831600 [Amorphochlora amoebiformis]